MTDEPIDLAAARMRRDGPDADCIRTDEYGRPLYLFTASYMRGNSEFALEFWCYDEADAREAVEAMNTGITFYGQLMGRVPG